MAPHGSVPGRATGKRTRSPSDDARSSQVQHRRTPSSEQTRLHALMDAAEAVGLEAVAKSAREEAGKLARLQADAESEAEAAEAVAALQALLMKARAAGQEIEERLSRPLLTEEAVKNISELASVVLRDAIARALTQPPAIEARREPAQGEETEEVVEAGDESAESGEVPVETVGEEVFEEEEAEMEEDEATAAAAAAAHEGLHKGWLVVSQPIAPALTDEEAERAPKRSPSSSERPLPKTSLERLLRLRKLDEGSFTPTMHALSTALQMWTNLPAEVRLGGLIARFAPRQGDAAGDIRNKDQYYIYVDNSGRRGKKLSKGSLQSAFGALALWDAAR